MPIIALPDLTLRNVRLTFNAITAIDATKITIHRSIEVQDRTTGSSLVKQRVLGVGDAEIEVEFWNTNNYSFADIPFGSLLSALTLLDTETTPLSILQTDFFTKFPAATWAVVDLKTDVDDKPGKATMKLVPNVLAVS